MKAVNECIFIFQTFLLIIFAFGANKLGKGTLIAWVSVLALIANLFVLKQISLFGLNVTASDSYAIGSLFGLNLLQEYHSKDEAKNAIWTCFFTMFFFAVVSQLHLLYAPSPYDASQAAFETLLSTSPRLFLASLSVFFVVQLIDVRFYSFLKEKMPAYSFAARAGIALVVSQFLDTLLFSFIGLYGIVESIFEIITFSFLIKLAVIAFSTTILKLARP